MKKGFTLIELLAVIVILAIIALIATPIILNIIDDTKISARNSSIYLYMDQVNKSIASYVLNHENVSFKSTNCNILENGNINCDGVGDIVVEIDGIKPSSGVITISDSKVNKIENLLFDGASYNVDNYKNIEKINKVCYATSGTGKSIGDIITCAGEQFYVISSSDAEIKMLSSYNLNISDKDTEIYQDKTNSKLSKYSDSGCEYENSIVKGYVDKYENNLKSKKVSIISSGILDESEITLLKQYDFYKSKSYWITANVSDCELSATMIEENGEISTSFMDYNAGIRPVITIKNEL